MPLGLFVSNSILQSLADRCRDGARNTLEKLFVVVVRGNWCHERSHVASGVRTLLQLYFARPQPGPSSSLDGCQIVFLLFLNVQLDESV